MWIRSQDKKILINSKYFKIIKFDNAYIIIEELGKGICNPYLGIYSTKEKALKVLDKIQTIIAYKIKMKIGLPEIWNNDCEVFQMPQNDEIK